MRILALSDIHEDFDKVPPEKLPDADLCVVAGDITNWGYRRNSQARFAAFKWMEGLAGRFPGVLFWVPGNHDIGYSYRDFLHTIAALDPICLKTGSPDSSPFWLSRGVPTGGTLSITGSSLCTAFDMPGLVETWDNTTASREMDNREWSIRPAADIVVSHCPPAGYLDAAGVLYDPTTRKFGDIRGIGSPGLSGYIKNARPSLVICGHAHGNDKNGDEKEGWTRILHDRTNTLVVNCARRAVLIESTEVANPHLWGWNWRFVETVSRFDSDADL